MATLRHPHVVPITDAGRLDDGTAFVVMERLHGQTLEERLGQRGALAPAEVISIVRGVAAALSVAHAAGVIHREIRADNVFIEDLATHPHGFARVLDFGVARLTAAARAAGRVVRDGSAGEAAPELRRDRGDGADHRADQFALATLAFRLLHGSTAPPGAAAGAAFERLWDEPAHWQVADKPGNPALEGVLARAMSWRADSRFDSVASFFCAFEDALAARPALAIVVAPPDAPAAVAAALPVSGVVVASPRAPAAPPASLTQQFFAEGDRQEAAASQLQSRADARSATDDDDDENAEDAGDTERPARSGTLERVPRRLAPMIGAVALGLVALAIIAHAAVRATGDGAVPWARESDAHRSPVSTAPGVVWSPTTTTVPAAATAAAMPAPAHSRPATAAPRSRAALPPRSAAATQPTAAPIPAPPPTATPAAAIPSSTPEPSPPPSAAPAPAPGAETASAVPAASNATSPAEAAEPTPSGESGATLGEQPSAQTQSEGPL